MTFKLPEPTHTNPAGKPFYTEAQLKQALRDVLEQAAQILSTPEASSVPVMHHYANAIRKMIGEI